MGEDDFDAVVIGSGFGGSVAAWRLKESCPGKKVLVLERGMPYPPGSFARTPHEMRSNFWDPSGWLYGLFEVWSFDHCKAIVSSGLGGGSLIYANVMLEKPRPTFGADAPNDGRRWPWPVGDEQFRELGEAYEMVKRDLGAGPVPQAYVDAPPEATAAVPKTRQFLDAAASAGLDEPQLAKIAVTFAGPGEEPGAPFGHASENLHDRRRHACALVGECDLGCNEGAKNTLDYTYLSRFKSAGGEIRTCCEAYFLSRNDEGYAVRYRQHLIARRRVERRAEADGKETDRELLDGSGGEARQVNADVVIVAAGTFGSSRLLLLSQTGLPHMDTRNLGRRFSSNGDILTVASKCINGETAHQRELSPSRGPVITAYATRKVKGEDLWMQDAGGPMLSEWGWQLSEAFGDAVAMSDTLWKVVSGRWRGRVSRDIARLFGTSRASSAMLPMLTMGRDRPGGRLRLDGQGLALDWDPSGASRPYFDRADETAASVAKGLGGRLAPRWLRRRARGVTVHPLGGCPMAADASHGVVDPDGQVFGCPGLFVADGSVMPGPVGPNPSLTIGALADHIARAAARRLASSGPGNGGGSPP
ncbi:MAG TPA: GMC family oxidoreductase [Solirubrobacteraceae bacterium]|jgi:cholesterol oxidase|nr:GMC family oxidoreductase [Solirubrobacteraceae bacterium]